jgi:hypothetical protein
MNYKTIAPPPTFKVINFGRLYVEPKVDLRWALDYQDRPTRAGMWNRGSRVLAEMAAGQPQTGIVRARVEAKDCASRKIFTIAECPGEDWIEFRWIAAGPMPVRSTRCEKVAKRIAADAGGPVEIRFEGTVQGMTLVSRHAKETVFRDGKRSCEPNMESNVLSFAWSI